LSLEPRTSNGVLRNLDTQRLRTVVTVAETANMTRAVDHLRRALSESLHRENALG